MKVFWWGILCLLWGGGALAAEPCPTRPIDQPRWAQGFSFKAGPGYRILTVSKAWQAAEDSQQYLLLRRGCPAPADLADLPRIAVPVKRLVALSTTYLPSLVILGQQDRLVATTEFDFINTPQIRQLVEAGKLQEIGPEVEGELENLVTLEPDLILGFALSQRGARSKELLERLGMPLVITGGHLEKSPLGRAEWILVLAALFDAQIPAQEHLDRISTEYLQLVTQARNAEPKPLVFVGSEFKGVWYVPGGQTYQSTMVQDAGGRYLWADNDEQGSLHLDFEAVLMQAASADIWLNPALWRDLSIARQERRFDAFKAIRTGQVYNYDNRLNPKGGNDYWETGSAYPNRVLKDLIKLLHPELLPEHQLYWYRRLQ
ncbi:MAG: ABC transporter substrate-binding protein [bacterium]|nr:ABC transporter substrate-binding protein [bacterium]